MATASAEDDLLWVGLVLLAVVGMAAVSYVTTTFGITLDQLVNLIKVGVPGGILAGFLIGGWFSQRSRRLGYGTGVIGGIGTPLIGWWVWGNTTLTMEISVGVGGIGAFVGIYSLLIVGAAFSAWRQSRKPTSRPSTRKRQVSTRNNKQEQERSEERRRRIFERRREHRQRQRNRPRNQRRP